MKNYGQDYGQVKKGQWFTTCCYLDLAQASNDFEDMHITVFDSFKEAIDTFWHEMDESEREEAAMLLKVV
jgi:hypothetical protein